MGKSARRDTGCFQTKIKVGVLTNGACLVTIGEEKVQTRGASIMWNMLMDVECNDRVSWDLF